MRCTILVLCMFNHNHETRNSKCDRLARALHPCAMADLKARFLKVTHLIHRAICIGIVSCPCMDFRVNSVETWAKDLVYPTELQHLWPMPAQLNLSGLSALLCSAQLIAVSHKHLASLQLLPDLPGTPRPATPAALLWASS